MTSEKGSLYKKRRGHNIVGLGLETDSRRRQTEAPILRMVCWYIRACGRYFYTRLYCWQSLLLSADRMNEHSTHCTCDAASLTKVGACKPAGCQRRNTRVDHIFPSYMSSDFISPRLTSVGMMRTMNADELDQKTAPTPKKTRRVKGPGWHWASAWLPFS